MERPQTLAGRPGAPFAAPDRARTKSAKIVVADDHPLVLEGICGALEADGFFDVLATTVRAADMIPLIRRLRPDVALLDVRMPGIDGLTCLGRIRSLFPDLPVVMLSMSADRDEVEQAFRLGAAGYILKNVNPRDFASAIRHALDGTAFAVGQVAETGTGVQRAPTGLTRRELDVMASLAGGRSNSGIARDLSISEQTVKFHLGNIFRKLGVSNRTEAARWAPAERRR
jgi:DNA-binding NarL/FixJ family response regulator